MKELEELINISRYYGERKEYVVAGGGNTSYKSNDKLWVKASGYALAAITEDGFSVLDRQKLGLISEREYSPDPVEREQQVKVDTEAALITKDKRPSVEALLHNLISYRFVVHLHPDPVNGVLCSNNVEKYIEPLFGKDAIYIPFIDPGYVLFKEIELRLLRLKDASGSDPKVIVLQNHGIFVSADTIDEVKTIYDRIMGKISNYINEAIPLESFSVNPVASAFVPAIRAIVSTSEVKTLNVMSSALIDYFIRDTGSFSKICRPFTPDINVYCKSEYIFIDRWDTPQQIIEQFREKYAECLSEKGFQPKIVLVRGFGLIVIGDNAAQAEIIADVFGSQLAVAWYAESFGGQHFLSDESIEKIDSWEVENYRRKVLVKDSVGRVRNKIVVVTGAAMGFGEGIARIMKENGANVILADINEQAGRETVTSLNTISNSSRAVFVKTDVTSPESVKALIFKSVCKFGGLDVFISNAGILRAGGLDDMTPEIFEQVTKVNYSAFFYCTREAVPVMRLQNEHNSKLFGDIIQINSKSGLSGSRKNFAYSGGKFGGIGLTQSFALELAPYRIKVNAICPGNYYEGPLWSDPVKGLFVQYLNTGKVPKARTVEDVKAHYLAQVPLGKGCTPADVAKAVFYAIEQENETGQAIPVTGGQIMIN